MAVRFAPPPDGRVFVAEKSGRIRVYRERRRPRSGRSSVDLAEEVHDFWDRGLLGMALDPAFAVNGRLYVLYTRDAAIGGEAPRWGDSCPDPPGATTAGCVVSGALARITVDALGVATEVKTLIQDEWCQQFPSHSVGTVAFGPDGMLYAGAGDGASFCSATGASCRASTATRRTRAATRPARAARCAPRTCARRPIRRASRARSSVSTRRRATARPGTRSPAATPARGG